MDGDTFGSGKIIVPMPRISQPTEVDGFRVVAEELLQAIDALSTVNGIHPRGCAMLAAHALECMLKAVLWHNGNKIKGHKILSLWDEVFKQNILNISKTPPDWVRVLAEGHSPFYFRYQIGADNSTIVMGGQTPALIPMASELRKLLEMVKKSIK